MPTDKDKKNNRKKSSGNSAAFETFALAGGKRNPRSGTTVPSEEGVEEAKKFVEDNKK